MSKISSIASLLKPSALAMVLALAANTCFSTTTLSQTATPGNATPPGCVSGYPNGTYRGDRPITRNETAAGLNTCLNHVNQIVPASKADLATRADFQVLIDRQIELNRKLQEVNDQIGPQPGSK